MEVKLIATRIPKTDSWQDVDSENNSILGNSLTDTLENYFQKTLFKGDFRLSPSTGRLFAILNEEEKLPEKKLSIYGDQ